jgi:hypothetical protein
MRAAVIPGGHSRQQRSAETRAVILAAAGRAFAKSGLAGARTDAIAAAAGVNKACSIITSRARKASTRRWWRIISPSSTARPWPSWPRPAPARAVLLRYVSLHFDFISARHRLRPHTPADDDDGRANSLNASSANTSSPAARRWTNVLERGMRDGRIPPGPTV